MFYFGASLAHRHSHVGHSTSGSLSAIHNLLFLVGAGVLFLAYRLHAWRTGILMWPQHIRQSQRHPLGRRRRPQRPFQEQLVLSVPVLFPARRVVTPVREFEEMTGAWGAEEGGGVAGHVDGVSGEDYV
jgi:hypothetical protein